VLLYIVLLASEILGYSKDILI